MATTTAPNSFLQRLVGAAALDSAIYEEVEADRSATRQAFLVVILSGLAAGIGATGLTGANVGVAAFTCAVSLIAWATWALVTYEIGARILPGAETSTVVGELLRTIGFAATPGILRVFGIVPAAMIPVFVLTAVWMLATMIVAVRQALDYRSTGRAIAVCALGWVLAIILAIGLGLFFGPSLS